MIRVICLKNFKCFENQCFDIKPLTILAGLNGVGKSTVLQALLLLRQSFEQNTIQKGSLSLNGAWVTLGTAKDAFCDWAEESIIRITLAEVAAEPVNWEVVYKPEQDELNPQHSTQVPESIYQTSLFTNNFQYLSADRLGPQTTWPFSHYQVVDRRNLGVRGEFTPHFLVTHQDEEIPLPSLSVNDTSLSLKSQVESWMQEIRPGVRLQLTPHSGIDATEMRFDFVRRTEVSTAPYRATNVGFGISYTLPIVVALLSAKPGSLLLLENPEAHLHPQGQAKLGELIARAAQAGVQIIVETHSDHVLNGIRVATHQGKIASDNIQIYHFGIAEKGYAPEVQEIKIDRRGRLSDWPQGFFDQYEESLGALLRDTPS